MEKEKKSYLIASLNRAKAFRSFLESLVAKVPFPDYTIFSIFAVIIGAVAGLAAVLFHNSIEFFNVLFFEQTAEGLFFLGAAVVVVIPAIGMLIQSTMILFAPKISEKRGVAEVIKAVAMRGGYIPLRTTIFHFLAPVICIGSGGTVGPEGPAAQLGGGVASKLGNIVGLSDSRRRIFTAAGSGAAIAAIFNTPLGGVFFALEIILLNDFHTPTFSALILASVTASAISRVLLGNESVFQFASPEIGGYESLYWFAILGVVVGLAAILFVRYSSAVDYLIKKKILKMGVPRWLLMISVGLLVGLSGFYFKDVFGIGYNAINHILAGNHIWKIVLILLLLKFILVPLILSSGGFGGIFAPSLFMGACLGYLFAISTNYIWDLNLDPVTFTLVGMGAMLGGVNTIPITAIMIIFEMTQDYTFILPLMLAVIISTTISRIVLKRSVHVKHLEEQGYQISEGKEINLLHSVSVSEIKLEKIELIPETTSLPQLIAKMIESPNNTFYITNSTGILTGIITETELRPIMTDYDSVKEVIIARDVAKPNVISVKMDDDLDYVLRLFSKWNVDQIPVIDDTVGYKILGSVTRQEVLSVYNRESLKANLVDGLSKDLKSLKEATPSAVAAGYSIAEISVTQEHIGKSLSELKLRNKFGLEVLMIKQQKELFEDNTQKENIITSDPHYQLKEDDRLVLFGKDKNIERFRNP
ncbi:MAG: chloride channel protein [Ignavibacteria bacterium]|nr:chloride channel protein [Ignavibacteria bacterium]MBT8381783.1 chloride channel protein [Ignavibacteria bacterium]MBT8392625.1 chloride channel protein [Ignavibacteria bacterium]NNJ51616.1 CBS domain-containing protein [Ignavibacteriaceae bacterium]NNL20290.1 CBS domain-containing protein [Ignavibacteriaceae bacterium]